MAELPTGTVTFLFTDIEGSTTHWERQPHAMRAALAHHDALLRQIIAAHAGTVFKTVGDAVCAVFPTAPQALDAALAAQRAIRDTDWTAFGIDPLTVRMAIHTGVAELRDGDYFGRPLNCVARLLATGHGGQILLSLAAEQLVRDELPPDTYLRDLGTGGLRGLVHAEHIYQLVAPDLPSDFPPLKALDAQYVEPLRGDGARQQNPYKGLRAFHEADAPDFFGRETLTERLLARLGEPVPFNRFLAVVGPSGSGKSSVVRAGLVPALRQGVMLGSEHWLITELLPGAHPLEELEAVLLHSAGNPPETLINQLREDERGLVRAAKRVLPRDETTALVLIIDQFEEVFTLVADEPERVHFLTSLHAAVSDSRSRVWVIITLRADFYDRPLLYPDPGELLRQRTEVVLPLSAEELERAIVRPAARVGVELEPELVATIIREVGEQPGVLPLLQHALTELFERRQGRRLTLAAYRASGGVLGALPRRAEEIYAGLGATEQAAARQLFLRLITLGEGVEDTRRRVKRLELAALAGDPRVMERVVEAFGQYRLLTFSQDAVTYEPTVEVAHEALLRTWERLREWLETSRANLRLERQLLLAAGEWVAAGHDTSFLATGTRLAQFEALAAQGDIVLTGEERAYLEASIAERQRREATERERLQHEADEQRRTAARLRRRAIILAVVLVLAVVAASAAGVLATGNARLATQNAAVAAQNAAIAATAQANLADSERLRLAAEANNAIARRESGELPALLALRSLQYGYSGQADGALLAAFTHGFTTRQFAGHFWNIDTLAVSPDGKSVLTGSRDLTARLWDIATGHQLHQFRGHTDEITDVAFSPDGRFVFSGSADQTARLWDVASGKEVRQFVGHQREIFGVDFSPDGKTVVTTSEDGTVRLWDPVTGRELRQLADNQSRKLKVAFSPDGAYVLAGGHSLAQLWDAHSGQPVRLFSTHSGDVQINAVAFSPDGDTLLTGSTDDTVRVWDARSGLEIRRLTGHTGDVRGVTFSPDGRFILSGGYDGTARLWDAATGLEVRRFVGHGLGVSEVAFLPDGDHVVTGSDDTTARLWKTHQVTEPRIFWHPDWAGLVAFSPDGTYMVTTGGADRTCRVFDTRTGQQLQQFVLHRQQVMSVGVSADGQYVLTASADQTARLWNARTGRSVRAVDIGSALGAALSPNGKYMATNSGSGATTAQIWDIQQGKALRTLTGHTDEVTGIAFSPDGKYLLTGSVDTTARLWDVGTGKQVRVFAGHQESVNQVAFSPDGTYALTASTDRTSRLWEIGTGKEVRAFRGHAGRVDAVSFSPDGRHILTGSLDKTARIWNTMTGREERQLVGHSGGVIGVAFSPDGKHVLTGGMDNAARLWLVDLQEVIQQACAELPRDFTEEERTRYNISGNSSTCPPP